MTTSCTLLAIAKVRIVQDNVDWRKIVSEVIAVLEKNGFVVSQSVPQEASEFSENYSSFKLSSDPTIFVNIPKTEGQPFEILFIKYDTKFGPETANLYRTIVYELEVALGRSNIKADTETSLGERIL